MMDAYAEYRTKIIKMVDKLKSELISKGHNCNVFAQESSPYVCDVMIDDLNTRRESIYNIQYDPKTKTANWFVVYTR